MWPGEKEAGNEVGNQTHFMAGSGISWESLTVYFAARRLCEMAR